MPGPTREPIQRLSERPLPHEAMQKSWQDLGQGPSSKRASQKPLPHEAIQNSWAELGQAPPQPQPQRASQKPLPHEAIQIGWEELAKDPPVRASQRPLPHVNSQIQSGWAELGRENEPAAVRPTIPTQATADAKPAAAAAAVGGLDEESFRHFAPMLAASQDYAGQSGFRFRCGSFDGLDELAKTLSQVSNATGGTSHVAQALKQDASGGSRLAAKLNAAPAIKSYGDRLAAGEPALVEELDKAYRIVVAESARAMMIATVKGLGLFPPTPTPEGCNSDDCHYEDASAPLPKIAQRLYNDHLRRQRDEGGSAARQQKRSMTAAFLVDFAHHAGAAMPETSETYQLLLQEFSNRNSEYADKEAAKHRAAAQFIAAEKAADMKAREAAEKARSGAPGYDVPDALGLPRAESMVTSIDEAAAAPEDTIKEGASATGWLPRWDTFFMGIPRPA